MKRSTPTKETALEAAAFLFILCLLILLAIGVGRLAESRGRSFWVYALFCFFVPIIALLAVPFLLIFTERVPPEEREPKGVPVRITGPASNRIEEIERLAQLRESGALSPEEYEREKARVLEA